MLTLPAKAICFSRTRYGPDIAIYAFSGHAGFNPPTLATRNSWEKEISSVKKAAAACMVLIILCHAAAPALLAVDGKKAQYVGGTVNVIPEKAEGPLATNLEDKIVFSFKNGVWEIRTHR
jgi:hypothetical protein